MRLVCVLFTFENNMGHTDERTDGRTDTTSYRDATAHLKMVTKKQKIFYNSLNSSNIVKMMKDLKKSWAGLRYHMKNIVFNCCP